MVICIEKLLMSLATLGWMLVSGPAATCSAFSVMTGTEMVGLHCQRTISSLHAQRQTPKLSNICIESNDVPILLSAVSRRNMIVSSVVVIASQVATKANADVSDGNALPEGAQQFARTIKLKTDLKDVTKRLLTASDDNPIDKKEWDNISKFLRTVYSTADNDMKSIAKGLSYNPPNQKQANNDVDEIKKYAQAGDISVSKQDAARLASILTKISELLDDFLLSLSDVPDEI